MKAIYSNVNEGQNGISTLRCTDTFTNIGRKPIREFVDFASTLAKRKKTLFLMYSQLRGSSKDEETFQRCVQRSPCCETAGRYVQAIDRWTNVRHAILSAECKSFETPSIVSIVPFVAVFKFPGGRPTEIYPFRGGVCPWSRTGVESTPFPFGALRAAEWASGPALPLTNPLVQERAH